MKPLVTIVTVDPENCGRRRSWRWWLPRIANVAQNTIIAFIIRARSIPVSGRYCSCFLLFALGGAALDSLSLMSSSINSFVGCTAVCSFLHLLNVAALMFVLVPQNHCHYILHYLELLGEDTFFLLICSFFCFLIHIFLSPSSLLILPCISSASFSFPSFSLITSMYFYVKIV